MIFVGMVLVGGCSDDEPSSETKQYVIDTDFINMLKQDGTAQSFCLTGRNNELLSGQTPNKYNVPFDSVVHRGLSDFMSEDFTDNIYFKDGKILRQLPLLTKEKGFFPVYEIYMANGLITDYVPVIYIKKDFSYDEEDSIFKYDGNVYKVMSFNKNNITLIHDVKKSNNSMMRQSLEFSRRIPKNFELSYIVILESNYDGYRLIADEARKTFGRYLNLNKVYEFRGMDKRESTDSIIDLDAFDAWIETQKSN